MHHLLFKINFQTDRIYWNLLNRDFLFPPFLPAFFAVAAVVVGYLLFAHNYLTCRTINPHFCSHLDFTTLCICGINSERSKRARLLGLPARALRAAAAPAPAPATQRGYLGSSTASQEHEGNLCSVFLFCFLYYEPNCCCCRCSCCSTAMPCVVVVVIAILSTTYYVRCYQLYFIAF